MSRDEDNPYGPNDWIERGISRWETAQKQADYLFSREPSPQPKAPEPYIPDGEGLNITGWSDSDRSTSSTEGFLVIIMGILGIIGLFAAPYLFQFLGFLLKVVTAPIAYLLLSTDLTCLVMFVIIPLVALPFVTYKFLKMMGTK